MIHKAFLVVILSLTQFVSAGSFDHLPEPPVVPQDGETYRLGLPLHVVPDPEVQAASVNPVQLRIEKILPSGAMERAFPLVSATTETVTLNLPGSYDLITLGDGEPGRSVTHVDISDAGSQPWPLPVLIENPTSATVHVDLFVNPDATRPVLTLDNSFSRFPALEIRNDGTDPLVLLDLYMPVGFASAKVEPINFIPDTVLLPDELIYIGLTGVVLEPDLMTESGQDRFWLVLKTNDEVTPTLFIDTQFPAGIFATKDDIPADFPVVPEPPSLLGPPLLGDLDHNYIIDGQDVMIMLLELE